jgi:radical SAM protein with 4Fe4S-binding SPASM domain
MKNHSQQPRFILRKEYFGGIILDCKVSEYELLNPKEFLFLQKMIKENGFLKKDLNKLSSSLKEKITALKEKGIIKEDENGDLLLVNFRYISPSYNFSEKYLSAPIKVYDTYTRKCNLNCKQCYASSDAFFAESRRTVEQTEIIMKKFYEAGVMEWQFTGGEPTVHPDFFEAVKIAKGLGMFVSLNTNGCWAGEKARKIFDSGIDNMIISLEGREEINDKRRTKGVYKQVMKTLDMISAFNRENKERKISVVLNMTVGKDNVSDIEFTVNIAAKYGFNINFVPLKNTGRAVNHYTDTILKGEKYMLFAKNLQKLREKDEIKKSGIKVGLKHKDLFNPDYEDRSKLPYPFKYSECGVYSAEMNILPDGQTFACPFLMDSPEFTGPNMIDVSVAEAWFSPSANFFRKAEKDECLDCRFYMKQCRGKCRAAVILNNGKIKNGKLIGEDPYCFVSLLDLLPK